MPLSTQTSPTFLNQLDVFGAAHARRGCRMERFCSSRRTCLADARGSLSTSVSHSLTTAHPSICKARVWRLSLAMLYPILSIQYLALEPDFNRARRSLQFLPCQKSPSQNTATRNREKTTSGRPGSRATWRRYRSPRFDKAFRSRNSALVFVGRLRLFTAEALREVGRRPTNDGARVAR